MQASKRVDIDESNTCADPGSVLCCQFSRYILGCCVITRQKDFEVSHGLSAQKHVEFDPT